MVPLKGVDTLLRAVALVARECPDFRAEVAGDGEALPGLKGLASELGVSAHVRFLGEVREIPALLARAALFVLPSYSEGISLTLLEAMACGLPVVATRVGGNAEVVSEGKTGLLVPPRDPELLARALLSLWHDPERSQRMGEAARQRAEHYFDIGRMVADYEDLYLRLMSRSGRFSTAGPNTSECPRPVVLSMATASPNF
jgi:glycosyltransferase involved in cell wall biosynthesis